MAADGLSQGGVTLFGKLPAHGDFVARGLTPAEQAACDADLARALAHAQALPGEGFAQRYAAAPPWRVIERAGEGWRGGALALSIDRGGRKFPVLLRRAAADRTAALAMAAGCEELLFAALGQGLDADALTALAGALDPATAPPADGPDVDEGWWLDGGDLLDPPAAPLPPGLPETLISAMLAVAEQLA